MPKMHDIVANRIAKKRKTFYNFGAGPDIFDYPTMIEVVMAHEVEKGFQKMNGFEGPTYLAGATPLATERAQKLTRGTSIGVMNHLGNIVKRSSR